MTDNSQKSTDLNNTPSGWREILDDDQVNRAIIRIAHEILEHNKGVEALALVGIRTRGEFLAHRLADKIKEIEGKAIPIGVVDITLYRDDLAMSSLQPIVKGTDLAFNVDNMRIVIVDDVLYTGRTVRAAIEAIIDFGRPQNIQLAVLCDRGHRELPIRADYVGKNIPTSRSESIHVHLKECDGEDSILIKDKRQQ
uniref:Bifunctional protein PyrR n=1 Tax=wastewater metagenome TaxID=527639 RepID=A0A0A8KWX7_9ZZZZ